MRILWLSHRDVENPRAGGAERTTFELGLRLSQMGHEFIIGCSSFPGSGGRESRGLSIRRYRTGLGPHLAAYSLMREVRPDVVVADLAHVIPWPEPLLARHDVVVCFRHLHARTLQGQLSPPAGALLRWIETEYPRLYRSSIWVTESHSSQRDLETLGIRPDKVRLIPPGIDNDAFRPAEKTQYPSLVYFGGIKAYKRPELVVALFSRLQEESANLALRIVGSGPAQNQIESAIRRLGSVGERVELLGRRTYAEIPGIVAPAWVNVHTSVAEGWCYSITEAAACGTPTLGFRVPGVSESVVEGQTGLLAGDGDFEGLVAQGKLLLSQHEAYGKRARDLAQRRSWRDVARDWESVLDEARGHPLR